MKRYLTFLVALVSLLAAGSAQSAIVPNSSAAAGISSGTPAYVSSSTATTNAGSITLNRPAGAVTGNLLLAQITVRGAGTTITEPIGWDLVNSTSSDTNLRQSVYRRFVVVGEPDSYIWSFTSGSVPSVRRAAGGILRFSNVDTVSPVDKWGGRKGNGKTITAPKQDQSVNNSLLVAFFASADGGDTLNQAGGMNREYAVKIGDDKNGVAISANTEFDPSAGDTGDKTSEKNTSAENVGHLIVLRPQNLTIPVPAGTVANDVMVATVAVRPSGTTIGTPTGWTFLRDTEQTTGVTTRMRTFYKVASSSEPASYTWPLGGSATTGAVGGIMSFSGVDTANPVDVHNGIATGDSLDHTAPSITTTVANAMLVSMHEFAGAASGWTPPSGMTEAVDIASQATATVGVSMEMNYEARAVIGATGDRTATANSTGTDADPGAAQMLALRPAPVSAVDHYELAVVSPGIACLPTSITLKACADASSPCTNTQPAANGNTAILGTSAGSLSATTVTFDAFGTATASLSYPAATDGATALLTLSGEQMAATNPRQCCPNGTACVVSNTCSTTFNTAGFIISGTAGGAAVTIPAQTAGVSSATYYLRAVRSSTTTQACEAALVGTSAVNMGYECNNPSTCTGSNLMSVNGGTSTTIARNNNGGVSSYTPVNMTFDANGNAPFAFNYSDAGSTRLYASKTVNSASLTGMSVNSFVTRPYAFGLVATCADGTANAASQTAPAASDPKFCRAGQSFTSTVTALNQAGNATPNYGRETTPETVTIAWGRQLPASGANGTLPSGALAYASAGAFGPASMNWDEVGILNAVVSVGDGDYLGAGDVSSTAYVGRFYPDHFDVVLTPQCSNFIYAGRPGTPVGVGQPFTVKASAKNAKVPSGSTTNYDYAGGFSKAVNLMLSSGGTVGKLYVDSVQGGTGAVPASKFSSGVGTVNFNDATGLVSYVFDTVPTEPTAISVHADDSETATSVGVDGTTMARSGRVRLMNANGSNILDLPMPMRAEYWKSAANGWQTNDADSCTDATLAFAAVGAFNTSKTCVLDTGNPGASGQGCASASTAAKQYRESNMANFKGNFNLWLQAPGASFPGAMDVTATVPAWLQFKWIDATDRNPKARATFGVSKSGKVIHQREMY